MLFLSGLFLPAQGGNFFLHLHDQRRQLFLALRLGPGVDISSHPFAVDLWRVAPFPEVVIDLCYTARPRFSYLALVGLEGGLRYSGGDIFAVWSGFVPADPPVDLCRRRTLSNFSACPRTRPWFCEDILVMSRPLSS